MVYLEKMMVRTITTPAAAPAEEESIISALQKAGGYLSASGLAQASGLPSEVVKAVVAAHTDKIRTSKVHTQDGDPVYLLNTPLSGAFDSWNAFRNINALKF